MRPRFFVPVSKRGKRGQSQSKEQNLMTLNGFSGGLMTVAFDAFELALLGDALKNGNKEDEPLGACQWRHTAAGFFLMASLAARLADLPKGESEVREFIAHEPQDTRKEFFHETEC